MKGLLLNQIYTINKSFFKFVLFSLVLGITFTLLSGPIPGAIFSSFSITAIIIDYIKKEQTSGWLQFLPTLPVYRKHIVQSHFISYLFVLLVSMILTTIYMSIIHNSIMSGMGYTFLGSGFSLLMIVTLPLFYKFGASKSNTLQLYAALFSGGFFVVYISVFMKFRSLYFSDLNISNPLVIFYQGLIFIALSIVIVFLCYFYSKRVMQKINL